MSSMVPNITATGLVVAFLPALLVIGLMYRWRVGAGTAVYATVRMLVQLLVIGYVLIYVFESDSWPLIVAVLTLMIAVASWIAIRHLYRKDLAAYARALLAVGLPSLLILGLVTRAVIGVEPWFLPRFVVPLAGMIIAGAMNAVGLAAERFQAEMARGEEFLEARRAALRASLIPIINSLFAVGLVALPGMMTGQILSGVSPLIAARYQIVVMTMLFGVAGMSSVVYLALQATKKGPRAGP
ncbi:MAG TPA: ABC transporter permease [Woeseiaceae bacterium]|nr:ABC transporter permease [Woeseiaceae bacterium]